MISRFSELNHSGEGNAAGVSIDDAVEGKYLHGIADILLRGIITLSRRLCIVRDRRFNVL